MKLLIVENEREMGAVGADIVLSTMLQDKRVNVSLTAGRSPVELYKNLIPRMTKIDQFKHVYYYTFDETPILNKDNKVVDTDNYSKVNEILYKPAQVPLENQINLSDDNWERFDDIIAEDGGLDLMLIGLGEDGHFCANMPECTELNYSTYKVTLTDDFPWNKPYQDSLGDNHSPYMYSMGPQSVMKVKRVVLIVNGKSKANSLKRALEGEISKEFPSTVLQLHPNITVICDKDAASELSEETVLKFK